MSKSRASGQNVGQVEKTWARGQERGGGARGHYLDPISKDTVGEQEGVQEVNGEEAEVCQSLKLGGQWTAECAESREQRAVLCAECCVLCDVCCVMCDV